MSEETSDRKLGESKLGCDARERVPENMRRDFFKLGPGTDTIKDPYHADEVPVTPVGRKNKRRVVSCRLSDQEIDGRLTDDTDLLTCLCVRKVDAVFLDPDPRTMHAEHFQPPESGQQHRPNSPNAFWMLSLLLHGCHGYAQEGELISAQSSKLPVARNHTDSQRRVRLEQAMPLGVAKKAAQRADGPAGNAGATFRLAAAPPSLGSGGGAPRCDLCLQLLHVGENDAFDGLCADQGFDVHFDPTFVSIQRRRLDWPAVSSEQSPGASLRQIPITDLGHRHTPSCGVSLC